MRIAVCHAQTPFVRGGAETHTESLVRALRAAGHDAEMVTVAGKWYPAAELLHQMAVWRSLDIAESNGLPIDAVVALKFPAYLVPHERKIVWLIHQHRSAYELWEHPEFADSIPNHALVALLLEGDEEFNEWSRQGARTQAEAGQPIVYVKIKQLEPARSRIRGVEISLGG